MALFSAKKPYATFMKKLVLSLCFVFMSMIALSQEILTNKSVIDLSKVGLSSVIIINKIKSSKCTFDLSTNGLVALKQGNVSDDVISAMIDKGASTVSTGNAKVDSMIFKMGQSGIYYYNARTAEYIRLDPTLVTGSKTTVGITGTMKSKSQIDGSEANLQVGSTSVFYFYFGSNNENKLSNTSASTLESKSDFAAFMQAASMNSKSNQAFSPNDFKLIKLDRNKNVRYFESGRISYGGISSGVDKNVQVFKYEAITPNLYRVYFPSALDKGEYCFIYATSANSGGVSSSVVNNMVPGFKNDVKVFDFGVR